MYCPGKRDGHICGRTIYKCKYCGNIGCQKVDNRVCSSVQFQYSRCLRCGKLNAAVIYR
ncbi:MAG: hypothetical protein PHW04_11840 [Candidatus Wallbacteria bacterium]|nr:hypothetical protein [Candidatus Wallbacteria bacterium]